MKNGDASVVLKNVTVNDTGTYECWVITSQTRRKRAADSSVHLTVSEGPEKEINDEQPEGSRGRVGLGVSLGLVGVVVVVGRLVVRSKRAKEERPLESVDVKLNP
ncbi:sodium channel regulatory subunit beta-2-like [Pseudochaenichthys georgianus]|uniref:sodium channel regulatory subunit beta-2-like n=1 Tax=Pseudochaenichthys georgianus TaxID=52239 RepID=UPI00146D7182|nr:sodium channel subunit beta-2-like [Pseudochaenichthys georgianus]